MASNKGKATSDEEMSKAAGGYIVDGGLFHKDKVYDSKGEYLGKYYSSGEAKSFAKGKGESDMRVSNNEINQLKTKGYFTRGNKKYHDNTWEYL